MTRYQSFTTLRDALTAGVHRAVRLHGIM